MHYRDKSYLDITGAQKYFTIWRGIWLCSVGAAAVYVHPRCSAVNYQQQKQASSSATCTVVKATNHHSERHRSANLRLPHPQVLPTFQNGDLTRRDCHKRPNCHERVRGSSGWAPKPLEHHKNCTSHTYRRRRKTIWEDQLIGKVFRNDRPWSWRGSCDGRTCFTFTGVFSNEYYKHFLN